MMNAIEVKKLKKSFSDTLVIDEINLEVPKATIFALLGTNGAGKTTVIKMLTTLLQPDEGVLTVEGFNVAKDPEKVRQVISLTGQFAAVDELLSGRENLLLMGKLRHLKDYEERTAVLLKEFELEEAKDRAVGTYSGGMRRKLDLAMSLMGEPSVLFLDEPTTGLDPQARASLWKRIMALRKKGVTIFLTTQYLEEADLLADSVAILNNGKIAMQGTVSEVKRHLPQGTIELKFADQDRLQQAAEIVGGEQILEELRLSIQTDGEVQKITEILTNLQEKNIPILEFSQKQPTLDDVFFSILKGEGEELS